MDPLFTEIDQLPQYYSSNISLDIDIDIDNDEDVDDLGFADEIQYLPSVPTYTRNPYDPFAHTNIKMGKTLPQSQQHKPQKQQSISSKSLISPQQYFIKNPAKNAQTTQTQSRPQISYDDILSSLNMQLVNGKLQINSSKNTNNTNAYYSSSNNIPQHLPIQPKPIHSQLHNQLHRQGPTSRVEMPIMNTYPTNSAISIENPAPIMSPAQYKRLALLNYIRQQNARIAEQNLIRQIKSTKLTFSAEDTIISAATPPQQLNRLFKFVGR
jgi:hypothetical protein